MHSSDIIQALGLEPHIEGGYFRRSHTSPLRMTTEAGERDSLSSIYYLLDYRSPIGHWHQNRSDILHFHQGGKAIRYHLINLAGELEQHILGPNLLAGETLQLIVPGGYWKASELIIDSNALEGENWGLISEAVNPGFDYADMRLANEELMHEQYPQIFAEIKHLLKPTFKS